MGMINDTMSRDFPSFGVTKLRPSIEWIEYFTNESPTTFWDLNKYEKMTLIKDQSTAVTNKLIHIFKHNKANSKQSDRPGHPD